MFNFSKSRTVVNIFGIPTIIMLIFLGDLFFLFFILVVSLFSIREFYLLPRSKNFYPQFTLGYLITFLILLFNYFSSNQIITINFLDLLIMIILSIIIIELFRNKKNPLLNISITLGGLLYIPVLLSPLLILRNFNFKSITSYDFGMVIIFVIFIATWVCDASALYFGKFLGRNKLFSRVSPNKTLEGAFGGFIGSFLIYLLFHCFSFHIIFIEYLSKIHIFFIFLIIPIGAQIGDLSESLLKRNFGLKDSSGLLGGHGGFLDRFDSILFSSPLIYLYFKFFILI